MQEQLYTEEDRDLFALSFLTYVLCDPAAVALLEAKTPLYNLLEMYKDRPYIDQDTSKQ